MFSKKGEREYYDIIYIIIYIIFIVYIIILYYYTILFSSLPSLLTPLFSLDN